MAINPYEHKRRLAERGVSLGSSTPIKSIHSGKVSDAMRDVVRTARYKATERYGNNTDNEAPEEVVFPEMLGGVGREDKIRQQQGQAAGVRPTSPSSATGTPRAPGMDPGVSGAAPGGAAPRINDDAPPPPSADTVPPPVAAAPSGTSPTASPEPGGGDAPEGGQPRPPLAAAANGSVQGARGGLSTGSTRDAPRRLDGEERSIGGDQPGGGLRTGSVQGARGGLSTGSTRDAPRRLDGKERSIRSDAERNALRNGKMLPATPADARGSVTNLPPDPFSSERAAAQPKPSTPAEARRFAGRPAASETSQALGLAPDALDKLPDIASDAADLVHGVVQFPGRMAAKAAKAVGGKVKQIGDAVASDLSAASTGVQVSDPDRAGKLEERRRKAKQKPAAKGWDSYWGGGL